MTLSEALTQYLASLKSNAASQTQVELHRFIRWSGSERPVEALTPPDVAQYAEEVAAAWGDSSARLKPLKEFLSFLKKREVVAYSLAPHVKIPKTAQRRTIQRRAEDEAIPMTAVGHETLRQELAELKGHRASNAEAIRIAAADKDFKENAPLDAARERQGHMEGRVREIEEMLRRAVVVDTMRDAAERAQVGSRVVLQDLASGQEVTYTLVDSTEADPLKGKISVASPIGNAVVGRARGDEVAVVVPKGTLRYRVTEVAE